MSVGSSYDNSFHGYEIQFISYAGSCNASEIGIWKAYIPNKKEAHTVQLVNSSQLKIAIKCAITNKIDCIFISCRRIFELT